MQTMRETNKDVTMNDGNLLFPESDAMALAALERKSHLVRDLVTAVAKGYKTGLYLYGNGGLGKSYTVLTHLDQLKVRYRLYNSRMTAKGLFLALSGAKNLIHVMEDMERITKDADAQGVLRSALGTQPGRNRVVTWTTATEGTQRFVFRGGLILMSNRPLSDLPELRALATRIDVHRLDVTNAELEAMMRKLASEGYQPPDKDMMAPEKCLEVTEHLLRECSAIGCPLDLRLQQKSFQTYLQYADELTSCHWHDLVSASVREAADQFRHEVISPEVRRRSAGKYCAKSSARRTM